MVDAGPWVVVHIHFRNLVLPPGKNSCRFEYFAGRAIPRNLVDDEFFLRADGTMDNAMAGYAAVSAHASPARDVATIVTPRRVLPDRITTYDVGSDGTCADGHLSVGWDDSAQRRWLRIRR
ncbi:MAG: hypothetical protein FWD95_03215 [Nocardioidaceae bacterium]|nr:hypothetical protein [Nocardioidaceae bacterium]